MLKILLIIVLLAVIGFVVWLTVKIGIGLIKFLLPFAILGGIIILAGKFFGCF